MSHSVEVLLEGLFLKDRRALSKLITRLDDARDCEQILGSMRRSHLRALRIGVTGPAGAGKSTLISALVKRIRASDKTVAVVACDPESPFTGGALLGDRVRFQEDPNDDGVFFRSLSSRGGLGGVSASADPITRLLEAYGFNVIIIETVGAGQDQIGARDLADVLVVLTTPNAGDDIQWEKAGMLEAADILVVNKSDLAGADAAAAGLFMTASLASDDDDVAVPVLKTAAAQDVGVDELWQSIQQAAKTPSSRRDRRVRHRLLFSMQQALARRFQELVQNDHRVIQLFDELREGVIDENEALDYFKVVLGIASQDFSTNSRYD